MQQQPNQKNIETKRRGAISLENSNGPPAGLYSPQKSILTIGDGDLSFSMSVSQWVRYKFNENVCSFVATTYDSLEDLKKLYGLGLNTQLQKLKNNGVQIYHEIDVNQLNSQKCLQTLKAKNQKFDRIIWNFPHAGFPEKNHGPGFEWEQGFHEKHIAIIDTFFCYAKLYLKKDGLVLMAHKTIQPFSIWNIQGIGQKNGYLLVSKEQFNIDDYPGYQNRRGAGKNGGKKFPIQDAFQYVFTIKQ